jgi:hypothetical protein
VTTETPAPLAGLRAEFPASQVGKLPKGNVQLDYVGHGAVTARLLDVDPQWNWEPVATTEDGRPAFDLDDKGSPVGLWIRLTVCGVTRLGFGNCRSGQFDAEKVLIGDALRNAAMRFGVALDLWIKGHAEDDEKVAASDDRSRPPRSRSGAPAASGPPVCSICDTSIVGAADKDGQGGWKHRGGCPVGKGEVA